LADPHIEWLNFIQLAILKGKKRIGILAPWGHGKTTIVIIGYLLWMLWKDTNLRIKIVCNSDENAKNRVSTMQRYIESDEDFVAECGAVVKPSRRDAWTSHSFFIDRTSMSIDPSVEAKGILTTGTGGRADVLAFDDPVDLQNSVLSKVSREKIKELFRNVWMPRLEPNGLVLYIATAWHQDDLTHEILANEEWTFLIQRIANDYSHIEQITVNL